MLSDSESLSSYTVTWRLGNGSRSVMLRSAQSLFTVDTVLFTKQPGCCVHFGLALRKSVLVHFCEKIKNVIMLAPTLKREAVQISSRVVLPFGISVLWMSMRSPNWCLFVWSASAFTKTSLSSISLPSPPVSPPPPGRRWMLKASGTLAIGCFASNPSFSSSACLDVTPWSREAWRTTQHRLPLPVAGVDKGRTWTLNQEQETREWDRVVTFRLAMRAEHLALSCRVEED